MQNLGCIISTAPRILVVALGCAGPLLQIHHNETNQPNRRKDEGTNGHRPEVVLHHAAIRSAQWEGFPQLLLSTRPVPALQQQNGVFYLLLDG